MADGGSNVIDTSQEPYIRRHAHIHVIRPHRARRVVVWAVITESAYVQQWQYGSALSTDWSTGSPIRFTTEWEGDHFRTVGDGATR